MKLNLIETYKLIAKSSTISIIELKKFEKICVKVTKLDCDIKYFESCQEMELIPQFLMNYFHKIYRKPCIKSLYICNLLLG